MATEFHISSLIVHAKPSHLKDVSAAIELMPGSELHAGDHEAKLIVLLETENEGEIMQRIDQISAVPGVIATSMIFHHVEYPESN